MNIGDYVRTRDGYIARLIKIEKHLVEDGTVEITECYFSNNIDDYNDCVSYEYAESIIIKSSPRIIKLVRFGDYVNGCYVLEEVSNGKREKEIIIVEDASYSDAGECPLKNEEIESIVTKERFESIKYNVINKED